MIRVLAVALTVALAAATLPQGVEAAEEKKVKAQPSTKKGNNQPAQKLQLQLHEYNKKKKGLKAP